MYVQPFRQSPLPNREAAQATLATGYLIRIRLCSDLGPLLVVEHVVSLESSILLSIFDLQYEPPCRMHPDTLASKPILGYCKTSTYVVC